MRRTARAGLLPRATTADLGVVALVATLVAFVTAAAAVTSSWLRVTADDMAAELFAQAPYQARQVQVYYAETRDDRIPEDAAATIEQSLAPSLRALVRSPRHAVSTPELVGEALPKQPQYSPSYVSVVGFPDARSLVDIVAGTFPRPGARTDVLPRRLAASYDGPRRVPVIEVALQREAADAMEVSVGTYVDLVPLRYQREAAEYQLFRVTGLYEAASEHPSALDDVDHARRPAISTLPEFSVVRAAALAADDRTVLRTGDPEVRWTFDPDGTPTAAEAEAAVSDARGLEVQPWPPVVESAARVGVTGIGDLGTAFVEERRASDALAALVLAAAATAVLGLLLAAASVLQARRRGIAEVLRARGAGTAQLAAIRLREAVLVAVPGLVVVGILTRSSRVAAVDAVPALAAAAGCVAVLTLMQASPWSRLPERVRVPVRDGVQIVTVLLAAGLTAALLARARLDASDPLLLTLPMLVAAATTVLAVRAVQWLTGLVQRLARRSRSVAPLVGTSQARTASQGVTVPVLALVLAGGSGLLGLAVEDSLHRGADRSAWQAVGADAVVTAGQFDAAATQRVEQVPGVTGVAALHTVEGRLDTRLGMKPVTFVAVDSAALATVTGSGPEALPVPGPHPGGGLNVLVTPDLDVESEETTLSYGQATASADVVGQIDRIPGLDATTGLALVDLQAFRDAVGRGLDRSQALLVAGAPDPQLLRDVVHEEWKAATVTTRAEAVEETLDDAVVTRTLLLARATVAASVVVAVFAAALAVAFGRPLRRRTLAVLDALGADPRQARRVSAVELLPAVAAAGAAAAVAAIALMSVAGRGIDIAALTGWGGRLSLALDPDSWAAAALVLVGIAVLVAGASTWHGTEDDRPRREPR